MKAQSIILGATALALSTGLSAPAAADAIADFYKGRQVSLTHTGGAGGGFAVYTRVLAKHIAKHIPGNPNIIVQFKRGGGGMVGMNYMYNAAARDGSYFLMPLPGVEAQPFLYPKKVKFDITKTQWVGNVTQMQSYISVRPDLGLKSWEDAKKRVVRLSASGKGSETYIMPMLMNAVLGTKFKVITGYKGIMKATLAMEKGESDGRAGGWTANMRPNWFKSTPNKVQLIVQSGAQPARMLYPGQVSPPNIPLLKDLAKNDDDRRLLGLVTRVLARAVAAPPGVPKARIDAVRVAFDKTLKDPAYLAEMNRRKMAIENPMNGQQVSTYINGIASTPKRIVDRYIAAVRN
jgi:tripartite-type tricarboxylate transporter receptor subunit TctC